MTTDRSAVAMIAELIKWKLSLAVAFSAVTGYLVFGGEADAGLALVAMGVFLLSSGAAALNQYTERKSDALMGRTAGRPLPSGGMRPLSALAITVLMLASGSLLLGFIGPLPLLLGLANVLLYNLIYTGLKKRTALSIIPGALVGAVPPVIGYTAAGGAMTDTVILLFALFMLLWQVPHFWLLLVRYGTEYEQAGIKTFCSPMTSGGINRLVLLWITGSSLLLWLLMGLLLPVAAPVAVILIGLNMAFIILFRKIIKAADTERMSKNAFILINSFSLLIMVILIVTS